MKRMCKFIFGIIFSIFMMGIISCSGQDESTNLTIAIDMSGLLPSNESKDSFARSVDDEKLKLEVTLIDLEDENNILPLTISVPIIDDKASVTFEKVPLFFKGRIEAIIFEGETPKFTGKSEEFIVHEGRNRISVHMEEVDNPTEPGNPEDPADPDDPNQPGDGTGEGSGDTGGDDPTEPDNPTEPDDPEDPADPNDPNQPGDGTGDDSGETGETEKTANYTVKHYQQNIDDDEYTLVETDTEEETGIVGAETSAEAKNYEGFEEGVVEQKTIAEDGTTVVQIMYDRKVITLTFDTDGGSEVNAIEGKYGAKITDSIVTTKTGYVFVAWNPTLPETFPSADSEYKATWTKEGDYTITYNLDGGTNANENPISYNVETETITLKEPTKIGYSFEGWKDEEETTITEITKGSTGNITLTAKWTPITYTVVFKPNEGDVLPVEQSQTFTYDKLENLTKNEFTRDGYTFVRWNTEEDGSGTSYTDKENVINLSATQDANVILYAQWKKIESSITIKFNKYSDIPFDIKTEGSSIFVENFVTGNYSIFAWEKDGVTIEGSENQSSINVSEWNGGIYTVTIIFKDTDNNLYSKEMQVTINKVNRAN